MPPLDAPAPVNAATSATDSHVPDFWDEIGSRGIFAAVSDHPGEALATAAIAGVAAVAMVKADQALFGAVERYTVAGVSEGLEGAAGGSIASGAREAGTATEGLWDGGLFNRGSYADGRGVADVVQEGSLKWLPTVPGSQTELEIMDSPSLGLARSNWVSEFPAPRLTADLEARLMAANGDLGIKPGWLTGADSHSYNLGAKVLDNGATIWEQAPLTTGEVGPYTAPKLSDNLGLGRPGFLDEIRSGRMS